MYSQRYHVSTKSAYFPLSSNDQYVVACCGIAIILSFFTLLAYFTTEKLIGGIFEASIGTIVFALWCGAIALIMNPSNNLAVTSSHRLRNTNLYFFTWASFLSSTYILASIAQQYRLVDVQNVPTNLMRWYLFLISSVVVFGTASKIKSLTCVEPDSDLCRTTKYAVSLGVVSAGLSIIPITWSHLTEMNLVVEIIIGLIVTVFYCVGVAYITVASGPGGNVGNLYFATWFGFGLSLLLTFSCFREMIAPEPTEDESQHPEVNKTGAQHDEGEQEAQSSAAQRGGEGDLEEIDVEGREENA